MPISQDKWDKALRAVLFNYPPLADLSDADRTSVLEFLGEQNELWNALAFESVAWQSAIASAQSKAPFVREVLEHSPETIANELELGLKSFPTQEQENALARNIVMLCSQSFSELTPHQKQQLLQSILQNKERAIDLLQPTTAEIKALVERVQAAGDGFTLSSQDWHELCPPAISDMDETTLTQRLLNDQVRMDTSHDYQLAAQDAEHVLSQIQEHVDENRNQVCNTVIDITAFRNANQRLENAKKLKSQPVEALLEEVQKQSNLLVETLQEKVEQAKNQVPNATFTMALVVCDSKHFATIVLSYNDQHQLTRIRIRDSIQSSPTSKAIEQLLIQAKLGDPTPEKEQAAIKQKGDLCGYIALYETAKAVEITDAIYPRTAQNEEKIENPVVQRTLREETNLAIARDLARGNEEQFKTYQSRIKKAVNSASPTATSSSSAPQQRPPQTTAQSPGSSVPPQKATNSPTSITGSHNILKATVDSQFNMKLTIIPEKDPDQEKMKQDLAEILKKLQKLIKSSGENFRKVENKTVVTVTGEGMSPEVLGKLKELINHSKEFMTTEKADKIEQRKPSSVGLFRDKLKEIPKAPPKKQEKPPGTAPTPSA